MTKVRCSAPSKLKVLHHTFEICAFILSDGYLYKNILHRHLHLLVYKTRRFNNAKHTCSRMDAILSLPGRCVCKSILYVVCFFGFFAQKLREICLPIHISTRISLRMCTPIPFIQTVPKMVTSRCKFVRRSESQFVSQ